MHRTGYLFLDAGGQVLAFAHRGGARHPDLTGLENTTAAFAHAVALGYRYLETDVHLTSDGVLVAFHDAVLDRVTDGEGRIEDLAWSDLAAVRIAGREPVPTLPRLVDAFPDARFNIDLKAAGAVAPLAAYVIEHRADRPGPDRFLLASAAEPVPQARPAGRRRPPLPSRSPPSCSCPLASLAVLTRRVAALQIPHRAGRLTIASPRLVRRAHAVGVPVHVWTIDDPDEMRLLLDRGVDGLMTDRTDILRDVLRERGSGRLRPGPTSGDRP